MWWLDGLQWTYKVMQRHITTFLTIVLSLYVVRWAYDRYQRLTHEDEQQQEQEEETNVNNDNRNENNRNETNDIKRKININDTPVISHNNSNITEDVIVPKKYQTQQHQQQQQKSPVKQQLKEEQPKQQTKQQQQPQQSLSLSNNLFKNMGNKTPKSQSVEVCFV